MRNRLSITTVWRVNATWPSRAVYVVALMNATVSVQPLRGLYALLPYSTCSALDCHKPHDRQALSRLPAIPRVYILARDAHQSAVPKAVDRRDCRRRH